MSLKRRNGKFLVFSRYDKPTNSFMWALAKVERGQLNILVTDREWRVCAKAAEMISTGKITEFGIWLNGYNACINDDVNRAWSSLIDGITQ